MTDFTFNVEQDGREHCIALRMPDEDTAKTVGMELAVALTRHGALRNGFVAVGEGGGDDVEWLGSWNVCEGGQPDWEPED